MNKVQSIDWIKVHGSINRLDKSSQSVTAHHYHKNLQKYTTFFNFFCLKGGLAGLSSGMAFVAWLATGAWVNKIPPKPSLPTSIAHCPDLSMTSTLSPPVVVANHASVSERYCTTWLMRLSILHNHYKVFEFKVFRDFPRFMSLYSICSRCWLLDKTRNIYHWSYLMYFPLGMSITLVVAVIVSLLTGNNFTRTELLQAVLTRRHDEVAMRMYQHWSPPWGA